jgi:hypothetical protein
MASQMIFSLQTIDAAISKCALFASIDVEHEGITNNRSPHTFGSAKSQKVY